jgi:hypothetical protein
VKRTQAQAAQPLPSDAAAKSHEPLFASAHGALTFAYNFAPEQYPASIIARLIAGGAIGRGKGLVGMDGAAQAGMILREVDGLGAMAAHVLAARFAPHSIPCSCRRPCCAGHKHALAWDHAIDFITERAIEQLRGYTMNFRLRRGLVCRFFGEHVNMSELAKYASMDRDAATRHYAVLVPWLKHEDGAAIHAAVAALKMAGICE